MGEGHDSEHPDVAPRCAWCSRGLPPEGQERGRVCGRCVRLLKGAGLRDEEIFATPAPYRPIQDNQ